MLRAQPAVLFLHCRQSVRLCAKRADFGAKTQQVIDTVGSCAAAFARKAREPIVVRVQLRQLIGLNTRRFVQLPETRVRLVLN
jgi:hypothetical protein